jgi:enolase-phosphatase E1
MMQVQDWKSAVPQLLKWIKDDVKHPTLKSLQGMIWKKGFESGEFKSHVYKDVLPQWNIWSKKGLTLGIYSSGSATAQKLFFTHTETGDLLPYLSDHFDLDMGGKREAESYKKIAKKLNLPPKEVLFLSDVPEELAAAKLAGMSAVHIVRQGTVSVPEWPSYADFSLI